MSRRRDPVSEFWKGSSVSLVLVGAGQSPKEGACRTIQPPTVPAPGHPTVKVEAPGRNKTASVA